MGVYKNLYNYHRGILNWKIQDHKHRHKYNKKREVLNRIFKINLIFDQI